MYREKITIIKDNISFLELPKWIQESIVENEAEAMVISFDKGVYTKKTAIKDAKDHFENSGYKFVFYKSSINGECADIIGREGWR